ncbi:APC family permease [Psychromicrobium lacuslunae]|uniref:Transporter n=1 Tax=Psychromicrobium lacuslunae TaxID=1618207 RepID=A0A0D4BXB7_9MICC|nr:APC family permease [Psychromicrobium lacuslunae]AJT40968.1 transporter [Psychromicrobium lacuslunae]
MTSPRQPKLSRRLGLVDATTIGMASMLGAGVFVAFAPAAQAAGDWLLLALLLAGVVAYCNASASAQLAAIYPESGGSYIYGRERLGRWAGFVAGWSFISGKIASCAAMAMTFGLYLFPDQARALAVAAVVVLTGANLLGVKKTAWLARGLLLLTLGVLSVVVVSCFATPPLPTTLLPAWGSFGGVFQAAAYLFFAFAGYARIATMGEEVRSPRRTIPLAILIALALTMGIYLALAFGLLRFLGPAGLAVADTPLLAVGQENHFAWLVGLGAVAASLGALLALIAGVGRTTLAMARHQDLPTPLAKVSRRFRSPYLAELAVAVVVIALILSSDILTVVGYSSFGVLIYYAITNLSALSLDRRPWYAPRWLNLLGFAGCALLAFTLPGAAILWMVSIIAIGCVARGLVLLRRQKRQPPGSD